MALGCLTSLVIFVLLCVAFQTIYFELTMNNFLIQNMTVSVEPYEPLDDYLRLRLADHEKFLFTHAFKDGKLNIVRMAPIDPILRNRYDWLPLGERIQYKLLVHKSPSRCMDLFQNTTIKVLKLDFTDVDGLQSNSVTSYVKIMTSAISYTDNSGGSVIISDKNNAVAYEVVNPDNVGGGTDMNITYGNIL